MVQKFRETRETGVNTNFRAKIFGIFRDSYHSTYYLDVYVW